MKIRILQMMVCVLLVTGSTHPLHASGSSAPVATTMTISDRNASVGSNRKGVEGRKQKAKRSVRHHNRMGKRPFAYGADISWVTQLEAEGHTFTNAAGQPRECTALMKELGMDAIRLRVWVDPEGGWNAKEDLLVKARRARALGMRLMIDFHYSDWWADPGKQLIPAAWRDFDNRQLAAAVAEHTTEVLRYLRDHGIDCVEWVQVGNETTYGMLRHRALDERQWGTDESPEGCGLEINPAGYAACTNAGYDAVKAVYPDAAVIVHVDRGQKLSLAEHLFSTLEAHGGKYDMIGLSLYPGATWQEPTQACIDNITTLAERFGRPVMICEVGMAYDQPATAREMLATLIAGARATGHCPGIFYWEPEAPPHYNGGYTMGAFDHGRPTQALDTFKTEQKK